MSRRQALLAVPAPQRKVPVAVHPSSASSRYAPGKHCRVASHCAMVKVEAGLSPSAWRLLVVLSRFRQEANSSLRQRVASAATPTSSCARLTCLAALSSQIWALAKTNSSPVKAAFNGDCTDKPAGKTQVQSTVPTKICTCQHANKLTESYRAEQRLTWFQLLSDWTETVSRSMTQHQ